MEMILFGGFLGSGKTTIISKLLHGIVGSGDTAAVIENEIGEVGIDDKLLGETGISVTPLFGGCVCCQITGSLIEAVHQIKKEVDPSWLIVEMTGLALMDKIRADLEKYGVKGIPTHTVSVADMSRWDKMLAVARPLAERQLGGVDVVFLNKTDLVQPGSETLEQIGQLSDALVVPISAHSSSSLELWETLREGLGLKEGSQ
ncbi:MAG: cobalamin biosynthesis protein P47K [Clostridiales bacterium]|nr:cobalamin biosynthesis protein P47K [Clostridiales bacterium]